MLFTMKYHLAQLNIAKGKGRIHDPIMADFVALIDDINALAESDNGFVWRLKDDTGNATEIQAFDDPYLLVNLSVWKSVEALKQFTYKTAHVDVMRQRKKWFHHLKEAYYVLWWIPAETIPSLAEAKKRLMLLRANGPSPAAFNFKQIFEPVD